MISDKDYLKAVEVKLQYEKQQLNKHNIVFSLPSHAQITKEALNIYGDDESAINIERHKAFIKGAIWLHEECIKLF